MRIYISGKMTECHDRYYAAKRRPKATCEQCGRRFQPLETTPGRFCSRKCYNTWQHEHGEGGRIDRKLAQVSARAQFLARRDLEAKAAGGVPEAQKPPRQETGPSPANLEGTR